jgi:hypothetical protein
MAEGVRNLDPEARDPRTDAVAAECLRQEESTLYTSTALYIWLREARIWNQVFVVGPVVAGTLAGVAFLQANAVVATVLAVLTGFAPALKEALRQTSTSIPSARWLLNSKGCMMHSANSVGSAPSPIPRLAARVYHLPWGAGAEAAWADRSCHLFVVHQG